MDWRIFLTTFGAIFVAELADKTQMVGMSMTAKTGRPASVLLGSVCGYIVVTSISVLVGTVIAKHVGQDIIKYVAASLFIIIGILMLAGKL